MMKRTVPAICVMMLLLVLLAGCWEQPRSSWMLPLDLDAHQTPSVLDGVETIEPEIYYEVPEVERWCDRLSLEKRRISVGDAELYVEIEGRGTPVVLLHGGPGATHHGFHPAFSRLAQFAQVIYYDQRGCGLSDYSPGDGYTIDQAVEDLDRLRQALGFEHWVVLGHSYGGLLAQKYALKHGDRLQGLVLVCAATGLHDPLLSRSNQNRFFTEGERAMMARIRTALREKRDQEGWNRAEFISRWVYNFHLNGDWKRQNFHKPTREEVAMSARYDWHHDMEVNFNGVIGRYVRNADLKGAFDGCPIPTLIVEGAWDLTWNEAKPVVFQRNHPGSRLVVLPMSGHSPFIDEPEAFTGLLNSFLSALPLPDTADLAIWQDHVTAWQSLMAASPNAFLRNAGWSSADMETIASRMTVQDLAGIEQTSLLLKVGFAFYEAGRYDDAYSVFQEMDRRNSQAGNRSAMALIWQGFMLDLADRRSEAIPIYQLVAAMGENGLQRHDQYRLAYRPSQYAEERLKTPFRRVENRE